MCVLLGLLLLKKQHEFRMQEYDKQVTHHELDRQRWNEEVNQQRHDHRQLEEKRSQLDREVIRLESLVVGFQNQLKEKEETIEKTMSLYKLIENKNQLLQNQIEDQNHGIQQLQDHLQDAKNELLRGNQVIAKNLQDIQVLKQKLTNKSQVIRQQVSG